MSLFTAEQKRRINDYYPALGNRPPGVGDGGLLTVIETAVETAIADGPAADAAAAQADATQALADAAAAQADADAAALKAALLTRELAAAGAKIVLYEGTDNGTSKVTMAAPASLGADRTITVPDADVDLGALAKVLVGWVTILNGQVSVVQAVGAAYNNKPVQLTFGAQPTAAGVKWLSGSVSGGNLTVTINVNNTADLLVYYQIDGR